MKLKVKTKVVQNLSLVKAGFTSELFLALNPPFPKVRLLRFDGCKVGDMVSLELNFLFFSEVWTSEIVEEVDNEERWEFVDVGVNLPFFLKRWRHIHVVERQKDGSSLIVDDIAFSSGWLILDVLMRPALWVQFWYRKPIYKKRFSKK